MLGFNTFVRTQEDRRIPSVAARNQSFLFIYLERSSDDVEAERNALINTYGTKLCNAFTNRLTIIAVDCESSV